MHDFPLRSPEQLPLLLQAFRKTAGLTQAEVALQLGVTQQTLSAMERRANKVSAERLMRLLSILGVELVLRQVDHGGALQVNEPPATYRAKW